MFIKVFLLFFLLTFFFAGVMANSAHATSKRILALYGVNPSKPPLEGKTPEQAANFISDLGANAIFCGRNDEKFAKACRAKGISVYVELGIFVGEDKWKSHPESRPINANGQPMDKVEWYAGVCPNQAWLRTAKLDEIREIGKSGFVDGIWLDFIRYPIHWENGAPRPKLDETCFCKTCLDKFQNDIGFKFPAQISSASQAASILLKELHEKWYNWRCKQITDFVADASRTLHEINPNAKVGLFAVPWTAKDYNDACREIVAQDWKSLAPYVDVFSPMVYHRMCKRDTAWVAKVAKAMSEQTRKPVWPITQAFNGPGVMPDVEFGESVKSGFRDPSQGVVLFSFSHIVNEGRLESVKKLFTLMQ